MVINTNRDGDFQLEEMTWSDKFGITLSKCNFCNVPCFVQPAIQARLNIGIFVSGIGVSEYWGYRYFAKSVGVSIFFRISLNFVRVSKQIACRPMQLVELRRLVQFQTNKTKFSTFF